MAPPTKRPRPSFSPPRPGKSKAGSSHTGSGTSAAKQKSTAAAPSRKVKDIAALRKRTNGPVSKDKDTFKGLKGTRLARLADDSGSDEDVDEDDDEDKDAEDDEEEDEQEEDLQVSRSRSNSKSVSKSKRTSINTAKRKPTSRSFIDDEASADEDEEDEDEETPQPRYNTSTLSTTTPTSRHRHQTLPSSSPEPDMILAEISTSHPSHASANQSPIPEALVHKMLTYHFQKHEQTTMSGDARGLVTKYLEVFVREAIIRSSFERKERNTGEGPGGGGGFLEVEDLERAAVQLCLDF